MSREMRVKSGECHLCDTGIDTGHENSNGAKLHTGDIVILWHGEYLDTDLEVWTPSGGLTCIVADQYQSFSDGTVKENVGDLEFFAMGIKGCGFDSREWDIRLVKKYSDAVDGEHWPEYGFSYQEPA